MEEKDFIVNIGPNGTFKPSGEFESTPSDVDALFARYEEENVKKITLFFHGGLVNEKEGIKTAVKMEKRFSEIGQTPICVVWETGLVETVSANVWKISETKLFQKLIKMFVKKLASKLGFGAVDGRGSGGTLTKAEIELELAKTVPFENYTQSALQSAGRGADASENLTTKPEDLEGEFKYEIESDFELLAILNETELSLSEDEEAGRGIVSTAKLIKSAGKIAFRVIKRFASKRDHDFYPTIIEEILRELYIADLGAWVWNSMKIKSDDMWQSNAGLSGIDQKAGRYLLDKIVEYRGNHTDVQVNLVGHSAGSIAICNLLKTNAVAHPSLVFENIIFMAPACRIDLFRDEIVDHQERFKNFRMFTMSDENEKADVLVPYFYTHSLLYLISGILEGQGVEFDAHVLGLERNIRALHPYNEVNEIVAANKFLFKEGSNRIVFSKSDGAAQIGLRTEALTHGGFDDDDETIKSIQHILS